MRKQLGQHFLVNPRVIRKIIRAANLCREDIVVEIGPGLGALTIPLSRRVNTLIAIELDASLCQRLQVLFSGDPHVVIIHANAAQFDYESLGLLKKAKVVANLPYYVATSILLRLLEKRHLFSDMILMLQKEVAERVVAQPGGKDYGLLSITCQLFSQVKLYAIIPPKAFKPPPQVESAILKFVILEEPRFKIKDSNHFFELVKCAFSQRRKTLRNTLKSQLNLVHSPTLLDQALKELDISPRLRGEALPIETYVHLSNYLIEQTECKVLSTEC